jgi:tetratricopeptide (TPR) repeat protein
MSDTAMPWSQGLSVALRGEKDLLAQLCEERHQPKVLRHSLLATLVGAAVFGVALGSYGMSAVQIVASAVKVPLLLFGTTALCFPSFHVFQTVKASKPMSLVQSAALQATALSTTAMIWAALSLPLFFLVSTTGHYALAQFLALPVDRRLSPVERRRIRTSPEAASVSLSSRLRLCGLPAGLGAAPVHRLTVVGFRALPQPGGQHIPARPGHVGGMTVNRQRLLSLSLLVPAVLAIVGSSGCTSPQSRREESLRRAQEAAANGDLDRAAETLGTAHGFDPRDRLIVFHLARIYEETRAYRQASRLVESFPEEVVEPRWLNLRARLLLRCGRVQEGVRLATSLARKDEAEEETFQTLSDIVVQRKMCPEQMGDVTGSWVRRLAERLVDAGEPGLALSWIEHLPAVIDLQEDVLLQGLCELAIVSDDKSLVRRIDSLVADADSPLALLVHRRRLLLAGRKAEISRLDQRFLERFPDDPRRGDILESEARRHLARGDLKQASSVADQALALDGSRVGALIVRGLALEWSGQIEEGRTALRTALALEPDNRVAREALRATRGAEPLIMRIEALEP